MDFAVLSSINEPFTDGLDESGRGLWRSAVESFEAAMAVDPNHPAPVLATAVCLIKLKRPDQAFFLMETSPALLGAGPEWAQRVAWVTTSARLAAGDPQGAAAAAAQLGPSDRQYALAAIHGSIGDWPALVDAVLEGRRPERPIRRPERPPR